MTTTFYTRSPENAYTTVSSNPQSANFFSLASRLPERGAGSPQAVVGAIMPVSCVRAGGQAQPAVPRRLPEAGSLAGLPLATPAADPLPAGAFQGASHSVPYSTRSSCSSPGIVIELVSACFVNLLLCLIYT